MRKIKSFLLSKYFVITIILLTLASVLTAYFFPQKMTSSSLEINQWLLDNPFWAPVYEFMELDHVYTTPWFAALLGIFLLILVMSTIEQISIAKAKTFGRGIPSGTYSAFVSLNSEVLEKTLRQSGYYCTFRNDSAAKFIKHPWGYWGNVLLHLGIVLITGASLLITVTESRGLLHLVKGDSYLPGNPWVAEVAGVFSDRFILPVTVKLDDVRAEYWENDDIKNVSTIISITDVTGTVKQYELGINRAIDKHGLRIYQGRRFGDAFFVVFTDQKGREYGKILQIEKPRKRDKPNYGNFFVEEIPYMLKAKYYADAEMKTMKTVNPLLVMRLVQSEQSIAGIEKGERGRGRLTMNVEKKENILGEVSLKVGEHRRFGSYTAKLVHVTKWSEVIFIKSTGMSGIFAGFFIIMVGVSLTYFLPPREIVTEKNTQGYSLSCKASKFHIFYEDEFKKVADSLEEKKAS